MSEGGKYSNYIGEGIDKVEPINGGKNAIRNAEENPQKPPESGKSSEDGWRVLNRREKNQLSDKVGAGGWVDSVGKGIVAGATASSRRFSRWNNPYRRAYGIALRTGSPIGVVIFIIVICISIALSVTSSMLASLIGNIHHSIDTLDIAMETRSTQMINNILLGRNTKGGAWGGIPEHIKSLLGKAGVAVETGSDGVERMVYTDSQGNQRTVNGNNFMNEKETSDLFNSAVEEGLGGAGNSTGSYYDSTAEIIFKEEMQVSRDRNNRSDLVGATDEETRDNLAVDLESDLSEATGEMRAEIEGGEISQTTDVEGTYTDLDTGSTSIEIDAGDDISETLNDIIDEEVGKGVDFNFVSQAVNGMCQVYTTVATINRMLKAYEAMQVASMGLRIFESIQRMQAGDAGGDDITNIFANYLTREKTTEFELESGEYTTVTTSAIGSTAVAQFFGGTKLTDNDTIVKSFVTSSSQLRKMMSSFGSGAGYKACAAARVAASLMQSVAEAVTGGTIDILSFVVGVTVGIAVEVAISTAVSILVPKIVNALKRDFLNFVEGAEGGGVIAWTAEMIIGENAKMTGMSVGTKKTLNAYVQKKAEVIADRARYYRNKLSPFDTSTEYTFMGSLMASLRRASLSTSSVVGNVGKIASIVGDSIIALTPASHAADAMDEIVTVGDYPEINSLVDDGQERIATAFGEPYFIPHIFSSDITTEDMMWYWDAKGSFEEPYDPVTNPNPAVRMSGTGVASTKNPIILAIKEGRNASNDTLLAAFSDGGDLADEFVLADSPINKLCELATMILEKINRHAPLGVPDAEIKARYQTGSTGIPILDKAIGLIPVIGGLVDTVKNIDDLAHLDNILGGKYHTDTKANQMFELYALEQRIGESMGVYKKAQTAAFVDKYNELYPADNTMVGQIARRSGLSREQVVTAFKQINALSFIADYHPDGFGPVFYVAPTVAIIIESSNNDSSILAIVYDSAIIDRREAYDITA